MEGALSFAVFFLIFASFYALCSLGLNLQWGFTGLFNVGIVGFFAIGAYTSALICGPAYPDTLFGGFGLPFPFGLAGAVLTAGAAALGVGFVTLRLREDFLAISTFGVAVSIQLVCLNFDPLTRGPNGLYSLPRPLAGLFESRTLDNLMYLLLCLGVIAIVYLAFERMVRSPGDGCCAPSATTRSPRARSARTSSCSACSPSSWARRSWGSRGRSTPTSRASSALPTSSPSSPSRSS